MKNSKPRSKGCRRSPGKPEAARSFDKAVDRVIREALLEDVGLGDVTTNAIIDDQAKARAKIIAKESFVVAGQTVAKKVFKAVDPRINYTVVIKDGARVKKGCAIAEIKGPASGMLTAERVALNFLQRLSGIATLTASFVQKAKGRARILDTRKTTPCLRSLEKQAVKTGGGVNHRFGLFDAVLIKDNHIAAAGGVAAAVKRARAKVKRAPVEVECKTLQEVREALAAKADKILLDNMSPDTMKAAVKLIDSGAVTEASGGVTLETVARIAATGVDFISVGALTHSARAVDMSMEFE